jgi:hypothetical protein
MVLTRQFRTAMSVSLRGADIVVLSRATPVSLLSVEARSVTDTGVATNRHDQG